MDESYAKEQVRLPEWMSPTWKTSETSLSVLIGCLRLPIQDFRLGPDFLLFPLVFLKLETIVVLLANGCEVRRKFHDVTFGTLGLIVIPLVGSQGLLQYRFVLVQHCFVLCGAAVVTDNRAEGGEDGGKDLYPPDLAQGRDAPHERENDLQTCVLRKALIGCANDHSSGFGRAPQ